jgi:ribonuclease BN (tRNA processing enzyme)
MVMHPCASGRFQPVQFVLNLQNNPGLHQQALIFHALQQILLTSMQMSHQNGIDLLKQRLDNGDKDHDISCKIFRILAVPHQQLNEDLSVWNELQRYLTVCNYAQQIRSVDANHTN